MAWQLISNWKTQINILWFGQVILLAMLPMSAPYWPLYIAELGEYTPSQIRFWSAAIYMGPFITSILSSPLWGNVADRYGYKRMVIRAALGLFITQTLILCFSNVYLIFCFRLLQGLLAGFIVAAQAWSLAISPDTERSMIIGKLQSATAIGNLIGPLMGGVIATFAGYHAIFSSSSLMCGLITILFICLLQNPEPKKIIRPLKKGVGALASRNGFQQSILFILLVIILIQSAQQIITPVFALFVKEKLGGSDLAIGILFAAPGLMIFMTATFWGKFFDKIIQSGRSIYKTITLLLFISAFLQVLQAYIDTAIALCFLRLLWGICLGALLPILLRLLVDNTAQEDRGMFLGFGASATKLGNLFGILFGALIEFYFGFTNSFLMTAVLYVIAGLLILWVLKPMSVIAETKNV